MAIQAEQDAASAAAELELRESKPSCRPLGVRSDQAARHQPLPAWPSWPLAGAVLLAHVLLLMPMRAANHSEASPVRTTEPVLITLSAPSMPAVPQARTSVAAPAKPKPLSAAHQPPVVSKPKLQIKPRIEPKPMTPEPAESQASPPAPERPAAADQPAVAPISAAEMTAASAIASAAAPSTAIITPPHFQADYLHNPAPAYPPLSARRGEQGKVMLRVQVSAQGQALQVELAQSSGFSRLDAAAQEAVRRWRFIPARQGEQAMAAWVIVPVNFKLTSA